MSHTRATSIIIYSSELTRATNGVGQGGDEGTSPLGFHSAIGQTKQPAALVRLEGDYADNPWAPMLYMREDALSSFNGKELVLANRAFDSDIPRIKPGQSFVKGQAQSPGPNRKAITQSMFLLTKHKAPFALDFPKSIRIIKNPDPERFVLAYQALSYAPVQNLETLIGEKVGSQQWDSQHLGALLTSSRK